MYLSISAGYSSNYYRCGNGETISILGRCNGVADCFSGEDEMNCTSDIGKQTKQPDNDRATYMWHHRFNITAGASCSKLC